MHSSWWVARFVAPREHEGQVGQQQVHPMELRRLGGHLWKMFWCVVVVGAVGVLESHR